MSLLSIQVRERELVETYDMAMRVAAERIDKCVGHHTQSAPVADVHQGIGNLDPHKSNLHPSSGRLLVEDGINDPYRNRLCELPLAHESILGILAIGAEPARHRPRSVRVPASMDDEVLEVNACE